MGRRRHGNHRRRKADTSDSEFEPEIHREELSYRDVYPDLDVSTTLRVIIAAPAVNGLAIEETPRSTSTGRLQDETDEGKEENTPDLDQAERAGINQAGRAGRAGKDGASQVKAGGKESSDPVESTPSTSLVPSTKPGFRPVEQMPSTAPPFVMPAAYIRSPVFNELLDAFESNEYDMDEQDEEFLQELNAQIQPVVSTTARRRALGADAISHAVFEQVMTALEFEWLQLQRRMPPKKKTRVEGESQGLGSGDGDDQPCAVCNDSECDNSNAIVFCDGCDVAVHQECYGVPFIPDGQWLCSQCSISWSRKAGCVLCPNRAGALKMTDFAGAWAHMLCALFVPEVSVINRIYMEPVTGLEAIPKGRWRLVCYICKQRVGACIQCANRTCFQAFHVTCARRAKLHLSMGGFGGRAAFDNRGVVRAYCDRHGLEDHPVPPEEVAKAVVAAQDHYAALSETADFRRVIRQQQVLQQQILESSSSQSASQSESRQLTPTTLSTQPVRFVRRKSDKYPQWRTNQGTPALPMVIVDRVCQQLQHHNLTDCKGFVVQVSRYWALKRQMKRGAALLKRYQLALDMGGPVFESGQKGSAAGAESREQVLSKVLRLQKLVELVRTREQSKLDILRVQRSIMDTVYFTDSMLVRPLLAKLEYLREPAGESFVSLEQALDVEDLPQVRAKIDTILDKVWNSHPNLRRKITRTRVELDQATRDVQNVLQGLPRDDRAGVDFRDFEPHGLTVHPAKWAGGRVAREGSPLSEVDDDELAQLEQELGVRKKPVTRKRRR